MCGIISAEWKFESEILYPWRGRKGRRESGDREREGRLLERSAWKRVTAGDEAKGEAESEDSVEWRKWLRAKSEGEEEEEEKK